MPDQINAMGLAGPSDDELLRRFTAREDQDAFHELVRRYLGMVFAAAMRRCNNQELAEEAAQNTFTVLARKAAQLKPGVVLGGWLHRAAWIETSELMRRECRRKQAMQKYADNADAGTRGDDPLRDALTVLDDALAALPTSDRDLLMLRFHDRLRFREIADRLGITEEASRKRVDRAVETLSRLLGKKGVAVPAGLVASGLGSALAGSAPAGLAVTVANHAIAASAAGAQSAGALAFLTFMTKTNIKTTATALVLLLGTASFFVGRHDAMGFNHAATTEVERFRAARAPLLRNTPASAQPLSSGEPSPARTPQGILEAALAAVRSAPNNISAHYRAVLVLRDLAPRDAAPAAAHLNSVSEEKVLQTLVPLVAGIWAQHDGPAAVAWAEKRLESMTNYGNPYDSILSGWAKANPQEAYDWYSQKAQSEVKDVPITSFRWLPQDIFKEWASQDPTAAALKLASIPLEDIAGAASGFAKARERSPDPSWILGAASAMPEGKAKQQLIEVMAKTWAREAPEAAAAWVDSVPLPDTMSRMRVKGEVAEAWVRQDSGAVLAAGTWLLAGAPTEMRQEILRLIERETRRLPAAGGAR